MAKKHDLSHLKSFAKTNTHLPDVINQFQTKQVSRRDFMRIASALGMSAAAVYGFAGGGAKTAFAQSRGGTLRIDMPLQNMRDPQNFEWIEQSNICRGLCEYLTHYGDDGVVKPYLAERWAVSADGKSFDLFLRRGIRWSNGDELNADDVVHNFNRWRVDGNESINNSEWGASVLSGVEKMGSHQVRLHLVAPDVTVAHRLFAYPTAIVHRSFDDTGADLTKDPIGTGPFELDYYRVSEGARMTRKNGYWGGPDNGGDAYLDAVQAIDLGEDEQAPLSALASGQLDWVYKIGPKQLATVQAIPDTTINGLATAQTPVIRFNIGEVDPLVRQAIIAAADNAGILNSAYGGNGTPAENHHTAPFQPDYYDLGNPPRQDLAKAAAMIEQAGMKGTEISLTLGNTQGTWEQDVCAILQQQCAQAGINLKLNVLPQGEYWEVWDKANFSLTFWTHRPVAVMLHKLAYRSDAKWNESHFKSATYDAALDAAAGSPDATAASQHMKVCQQELVDNHVMVQPFWIKLYSGGKSYVKNFPKHQSEYYPFHRVSVEA